MESKCYNLKIVFVILLLSLNCIVSCKKFIEVEAPVTSLNGLNVYNSDATAISAVTSIYAKMSQASISVNGIPSVSLYAGLSSDELSLLSSNTAQPLVGHYKNALSASNAPVYWTYFYQSIYQANVAIEGIRESNSLSAPVRQQLLGELYFIRAFCYFYLVNLYGDVPLVITSDYKVNSLMERVSSNHIWEQIIKDLLDAKGLLINAYVESDLVTYKSSTERIRPNKSVATALLARCYLYRGDFSNAESESSSLINMNQFSLASLNNAFLKGSPEAIWQLQPVTTGWNTQDARVFILPSTGPNTSNYPVYVNKNLLSSFEVGDNRKVVWLDSVKVGADTFYYPHKYKNATLNAQVTEYNIVFRLSEQYLIRAEAKANLADYSGAQNDINEIRKRAGLFAIFPASKDELLRAILRERRSELFSEWGHRWLDLKRSGQLDKVMSIESQAKGGSWDSYDKFYPISTDELLKNSNLLQTDGYN